VKGLNNRLHKLKRYDFDLLLFRLRDKYGRVGYLVREIDELRMRNELLAREIQRRRQVNGLHQINEG